MGGSDLSGSDLLRGLDRQQGASGHVSRGSRTCAGGRGGGSAASQCRRFDGQWASAADAEHMATILGVTMHWTDGPTDQLRPLGFTSFECDVFDQTLTAQLGADGKLRWSDGDIWVRVADPEPLRSPDLATAAKDKGNEAFKANNFKKAIKHYTDAIGVDPSDHIFYSNRSACYASLGQYREALEDGEKCVKLAPDWAKGYTRKGLAEFGLGKYEDAAETYKAGMKLSPDDPTFKEGMRNAFDAMYAVPQSQGYGDPVQWDMHRPRTPSPPREAKEEHKQEEPPPDLRTPEQKEADGFKHRGNEFYKVKQFEQALEMYRYAIEKEPNDMTYHNNMCAVYVEMGEEYFPKVLEICNDLITRRYEINSLNPGGAAFEKVAKVFARIAGVYEKSKQYDEAIEYYRKALTEDNSRQTRNALREVERKKEKWEKESYIDHATAEVHREQGNELFKQQDWKGAKEEYDEAIRRNPTDARLYSNRAAALTNLCAHPEALRDLGECLKLDPTFVKAYSRKAVAHYCMKEYHKALQAYEQGLRISPDSEECLKGREQVMNKIQEASRSDDIDEEQIQHAMADPEIQQILKDPQIDLLLRQMGENPALAEEAIRSDARLQEAVAKLTASGIIRNR